MGFFKNLVSGVKKTEKKAEEKIHAAGKKLSSGVKKLEGKAKWALLKPFAGTMKKLLAKKDIKADNTIEDIATKFYTQYLGYNLPANYDKDTENFVLTAMLVEQVVDAIIGFVKHIREKKKNGEKTTPDEDKMLDVATKEAAKLSDAVDPDSHQGINLGDMFKDPIMIGILIVVVIFIFKR